ncbi:MAG: glycosyltransferase family 87 protein [Candidatus Sumerlaeota bacterium]|nr:glycosyltransferase family 87 protein [Candidatus Sumerlaeota bacterium]
MARWYSSRNVSIAIRLFVIGFFIAQTARGIHCVRGRSDFEVYYRVAASILKGAPRLIYNKESPHTDRSFLYPPPASILLTPLAILPFVAAGVVFSLIKMAALGFFLWGAIRFGGAPPGDRKGIWAMAAATILIVYRPIDNDIGNGQINIIVWALAAWGVWLMMSARPKVELGGMLWACSVALKATPLLLLGVLILHKRWYAMAVSVVWLALFMGLLPVAWFGGKQTAELYREFSMASTESMMVVWQKDHIGSINELFLFTLAQAQAPKDLVIQGEGVGGKAGEKKIFSSLPDPLERRAAKAVWLGFCALAIIVFMGLRKWAGRGRGYDWRWDLAMLSTMALLLSPVVRGAHLVILIAPIAWAGWQLRQMTDWKGGWQLALRQQPGPWIALGAATTFLWVSKAFAFPSPGPMLYRPAFLLANLSLFAALVMIQRKLTSAMPEDGI